MIGAALALSWLVAQPPCTGVFDRTERCPAPDEEGLFGAVEPLSAKASLDEARPDTRVLGAQIFVAGFAVALGSAAAVTTSVLYGLHLGALEERGRASAETRADLEGRQGLANTAAVTLGVVSAVLFGTGAVFFAFDPAEGDVFDWLRDVE